ncbi:hypothetical protein ACQEU3_16040 [Spirillospora sp. CA-253888]
MKMASRRIVVATTAVGVGTALTATVVVMSGADERSAAPAGAAANERAWRQVPPTAYPGSTQISDITATPGGGVWAGGNLSTQSLPLVERLTSKGWARLAIPSTLPKVQIHTIGASSATNVWVGGSMFKPGATSLLRWNGAKWSAHSLGENFLPVEITPMSANDVWVAGNADHLKRWNGSTWRNYPLGFRAQAISGVSAKDLWAVGLSTDRRPAAAHWNGTTWRRSTLPGIPVVSGGEMSARLNDVVALAPNNVWAAGSVPAKDATGRVTVRALLARWNGAKWTTAIGANDTAYSEIEGDGAGGLWILDGTELRHRTKAGVWTRAALTVAPGLRPQASGLALRPGTRTVWAGGYVPKPSPATDIRTMYWRND